MRNKLLKHLFQHTLHVRYTTTRTTAHLTTIDYRVLAVVNNLYNSNKVSQGFLGVGSKSIAV